MRRGTLMAIIVGVVALATAGGTITYLLFGVGQEPAPVALASEPAPTAAPPAAPAPGQTADGTWNVVPDANTFVGYRVTEQLASFTAPNEAVGRTPEVSGTLTVQGTQVTATQIVANLTALASDEPARDRAIQSRGLESATFPEATFTLTQPIEIGQPVPNQPFTATAAGDLTLHGATRPVQISLDARWTGDSIEVAGSAPVVLSDFGIEAPVIGPVLSIQDQATVELLLVFRR